VVLLCPTVPLAQQQHESWKRLKPHLGAVAAASSDTVVAGSGAAKFGTADVTFGTPAKFVLHLNSLEGNLRSGQRTVSGEGTSEGCWGRCWEHCSLLVMDECHHANRLSESKTKGKSNHA
jgi:superfamily II DNA or RNA helicase